MKNQTIGSIQALFQSRLITLEHLLKSAQTHFDTSEKFLEKRIISDMLPLGTQIVFTCNQPRNFALWCDDQPAHNLDPEITSTAQASEIIAKTKSLLANVHAKDEKLSDISRIPLGQGLYLELTGHAYVNDFLMPNFYFHLVTAYDILRMAGVNIGKRDYMMHLVPLIQQE